MERQNWYKLDNAGKLYPSIASTRRSTVFRLSAKLTKTINPEILQKALDQTIKRFPYYKVNLKRGLFWYYFEGVKSNPKVQPETYYPCMFLNFRKKGTFPFRVLYYNQYIHFEISHSIADGNSGLIFLKTLLIQYFNELDNIDCDNLQGGFNLLDDIDEEEYEDAFRRYCKRDIPTPKNLQSAKHFPFELMEKGRYLFITGISEVSDFKIITKQYNCSVTHLVTAVYFLAIQDYVNALDKYGKKNMQGRIVINLPVDLRQLFPSKTMKNFFVSLTPAIDLRLGEYELEELINYVKGYMQLEYNSKHISQFISKNVKNERMMMVRIIPLWLKNRIIPYLYNKYGEKGYTSSISNLGFIKLPEEINPYVEAIEFFPAPSEISKSKMCMNAYKDHIYISFGKTTQNTEIETCFFRRLRKMGINIKIESNYEQKGEN